MISARAEGDELVIDGEAQVGDVYPGICCTGHGWEVILVFPSGSVWGGCANPHCPQEADSHYHRISSHDIEDIALTLIGERQGHND